MVRCGRRNGTNCRFRGFPKGSPRLKLKSGTTRLCCVGYATLSTCELSEFRYVNNSLYGKKVSPRSASGVMAVVGALVAGACAAVGFCSHDVVECENSLEQLRNEVEKSPLSGSHMLKYDHVVIGSGTTASAAIEGILLMQPDAKILLIAQEPRVYPDTTADSSKEAEERIESELAIGPDLLESFIQWRRHISKWLADDCEASGGSVDVIRNSSVKIDIDEKTILIGEGVYHGDGLVGHLQRVKYKKCVLAPTGKPRKLYVLDGDRAREELRNSINTLQSLEVRGKKHSKCIIIICSSITHLILHPPIPLFLKDFQALETLFTDEERNVRHVTVIGGGFLGAEVAVALAKRGAGKGIEVANIYAEQYPMQRILPPYLAKVIQKKFEKMGITPVNENLVTDIRYDMDSGRIELLIKGWGK